MIYSERFNHSAYSVNPDGKAEKLNRLPLMTSTYNETWLQKLIENNPNILPSGELGIEYSNLVCIGTEVEIGSSGCSGRIDNLYVSPTGAIVIVETKLFRNQESKRMVVAQIIEYAKELKKWNCENLDTVAETYTYKKTHQASRIIDLMAAKGLLSYGDEAKLTDRINENLTTANFLLLIVGDGIRSGIEQMAEFLNSVTSMSFKLALVEIELYQKGEQLIIIPNIVNKASVYDRNTDISMFHLLNEKQESKQPYVSKPILTRKEYIEQFADNGGYDKDMITDFVGSIDIISGIVVVLRPTELQIRFASSSTTTQVLMTFSISGGKADVWVQPKTISDELAKHGLSSKAYDDFLMFYKDYVDLDRCKVEPFVYEKGFYFAQIDKMLNNTDEFIKACETFANTIASEIH